MHAASDHEVSELSAVIPRSIKCGLILCVLWLLPESAGADGTRIEARVSEDLSVISVTVYGASELRGFSDSIWAGLHSLGNGYIRGRRLRSRDGGLPITYSVDLDSAQRDAMLVKGHSSLRLADWTQWLLMPESWSMGRPVPIVVYLPVDIKALLPFTLVSHDDGVSRYTAYPLLPHHGGLSAFGKIAMNSLTVADQSVTVSIIGRRSNQYADWIRRVLEAATATHGLAPNHASIVLIEIPSPRGTVPWAHVKRGGGNQIIAYVADSAPMAQLHEDWTLYHEVMHLYHPYLSGQGRWVSEGFASYFQNLYRAQDGSMSPRDAFGHLWAGLERGRKENERSGGVPVREGGRMRTYWTGAAMALNTDYKIREHSGGSRTLGTVLGEFAKIHLPSTHPWHARQYMDALDDIVGFPLMRPEYDRAANDPGFPVLTMDREQAIRLMGDRQTRSH